MANQRFNIRFDFEANLGPVKNSVAELQKNLSNLNLPANMTANFERIFSKLSSEMADFQALTKNGFTNMSDVNKAQTAFARIQKLLNQLGVESSKIKGLDPNKLIPQEVTKRVSDLTAKWAALNEQSKKKDGFAEKIKAQNEAIEEQQRKLDKLITRRNALASENKSMGSQKSAESAKKKAAQKELDVAIASRSDLEGKKGGKSSAEYAALGQEITRLGRVIGAADTEIARLTTSINKNKTAIIGLDGDIAEATQELDGMKVKLTSLQNFDIDIEELTKLREELAKTLNLKLDEVPTDLEAIKKAISSIPSKNLQQFANGVKKVNQSMDGVEANAGRAANGLRQVVRSCEGADRAASDMENLRNRVLQFFSITNSVQLFKRAIRGALNTVKELDATMTEAAVVTNFSVGDMWEKLPQYSKEANKLGVSINSLYGATTLYYQQGLKTNEAMSLGIETMKMARIAGMEAADATEAMTAALRGFNMELSEASAVRVNDVYSELAAVTAADTEQIATAMSKTASIAHNANMEFETTAALLAQIIETTQEAPETAGTAMKTIIARFSEVKSLKDKGEDSGKDEEGEIIDVNKIQTALRTVGISMEGFFEGTEGLDSILLKLAEKWETLDFQTQRYIATTAAGSRQQSRFIAMMSDYSRTTELVASAQDSAGASQRQFNKTQDSMEAKLQKLQNAWDQFLMGLANNEILKGAIDALTFIINGVNKLTDALSGGNGLVKSLISLVTVIGALKGGRSLLGGALGWTGQKLGINPQTQPNQKDQNPSNVGGAIMPNPQQQGQQAGQSYGKGLMSGILQSLESSRFSIGQKLKEGAEAKGGKYMAPKKGGKYMATPEERQRIKYERKATKQLKNQYGANLGRPKSVKAADSRKQGFLGEIKNRNANFNDNQLKEIEKAYDSVYQKTGKVGEAMDAASAKTRQLGGTMMDSAQQTEMMSSSTQNWANGLSAAGGAILGLGAALGLLSGLFDSLGMEEASEATSTLSQVFMGLGSVLMVLPSLITGVASVATAAGISVQAAWWWLLIIAAVIAAIVAVVYLLVKAWEAASEAAQLEKMNEQLNDLSEAADEAKSKLDDMASAKKDLEGLSDAFEGLTKGSREWKQALIENNQEVLELLNKYPELASYVSKGLNGELTISEEGWNTAMDAQQEIYTHTLGAKTAMQSQVKEKEQYIAMEQAMAEHNGYGGLKNYADFVDTGWGKAAMAGGGLLVGAGTGAFLGATIGSIVPLIGTAIGAAIGTVVGSVAGIFAAPDIESVEKKQTGGLTYDEMTNFAALAAERGYTTADGSLDATAAQGLLDELGLSIDNIDNLMSSINNLGTSFDELANGAYAAKQAELARVDAIAANVAQTSSVVSGSTDFGAVAEEMGARSFENYDDRVAKRAETYVEDLDVADKNLDSGKAAQAIEKYAKIQGIEEAEARRQLENDEITKETIASTIAASEVDAEMKKAMEGTVKVFERIAKDKSDKDLIKAKSLMTDRGEGLNVGALSEIEAAGSMEEYLFQLGFEKSDAETMGYESWEAYVKAMESNYTTGIAAFEQVRAQIEEAGLSFEDLPETLTAGTAQGLADKLNLVVANEGTAMAQQVLTAYENITKGLNPDQVQTFTEYMTDINWNDAEAVETFGEQLKLMGLNIPESEIENFINLMKEAGNAFDKLDLEKITEQATSLQKMVRDINEGEQDRTFSAENFQVIKDTLPTEISSEFVKDLDGNYVYIGNSMQELIIALQTNTAALLGKSVEQLAMHALVGQSLGNNQAAGGIYGESTRGLDILSMAIENEEIGMIKVQIAEVIREAVKNGYDVATLGIEGLTNNVNLDVLTNDQLLAMGNSLLQIGASQIDYEDKMAQAKSENAVLERSNYNPYNLIGDVNDYGYTSQGQDKKAERDGTYSSTITKESADALRLQAVQFGVSEAALKQFNEAMETGTEYQKRMAAAVLASSIEEKKQEKQYGRTLKKLDDVNQVYKEVEEGAQGYSEALYAYGEALGLDMTDTDNLGFVADNLDLIRQAAEGDIDSIMRLNQLLAAEHGLIITADGNFDLYNSKIDEADQKTQQFIADQYAAGAYEVVEEEVEAGMQYLKPTYDANGLVNGFSLETAETTQTVQMLRPQDASSIDRAQNYSSTPKKSGGGGSKETFENPYDVLHNVLEEINDLLRERERLERRYQRLLDQGTATAEKLAAISRDNIANQKEEIEKQQYIITNRKAQVEAQLASQPDMKKYVYTETDSMGNKTIRIDWAAINAISDTKEGEKVTEFYDKIDEWLESIYEAEEAIYDAEDAIWEELQQGKDEYLDLEEQVKEAIVSQRQEEIDKLTTINDTINETNASLIESMQSAVDKYRQDRQNEKTEEELSDKQRRLAYLQQDTSSANDLEIMKLQEEIEQGQQDYTDTLIDQKISDLQEQNDKAAEQRQQQIDIMQAQLDKYVESGEIWDEVQALISAGTNAIKNLLPGSELETLLKEASNFNGMSKIQQMDWMQTTNVLIAQALKWLSEGAVSTFATGKEITFTNADGKSVKGVVNEKGEVVADGQIYQDVSMDADGNYHTQETEEDARTEYQNREDAKKKAEEDAAFMAKFPYGIVPSKVERTLRSGNSGDDVKALQDALNKMGYDCGEVDGIFGWKTTSALKKFQKDAKSKGWNPQIGHPDGVFGPQTKKAFAYKQYKTGGLADFTGPAWLDGTKSRPEYILNAEQTKGFFALVDVLTSLQNGVTKSPENNGDNTYDIDINVESIGSDYDVEQMAETIKRLINEDARYRNNNTINLAR